jgi:hypothetical protein
LGANKVKLDAQRPRDHELDYRTELETWEKVLAWSNKHVDRSMAELAHQKVSELRKRLEGPVLQPLPRSDGFEATFTPPTIEIPDFSNTEFNFAELAKSIKPYNPSEADRMRYAQELNGNPSRILKELWNDRLAVQDRRAAVPSACSTRGRSFHHTSEKLSSRSWTRRFHTLREHEMAPAKTNVSISGGGTGLRGSMGQKGSRRTKLLPAHCAAIESMP